MKNQSYFYKVGFFVFSKPPVTELYSFSKLNSKPKILTIKFKIMKLKQSQRQQVKLRLGLSGASGFGKTKSALLLGYGMTQDWSKIAVIDTENSSASLYSDLGNYNVLDLQAPYSPERYIQAIELCEKSGIEVIIIDSASHEWNGTGGCLDIHEKMGGRFQDWANVTPRHQSFINKILQSTCHVITTTRRKMDYSLDIGSRGVSSRCYIIIPFNFYILHLVTFESLPEVMFLSPLTVCLLLILFSILVTLAKTISDNMNDPIVAKAAIMFKISIVFNLTTKNKKFFQKKNF
ncbi:hypothetical protein GCM10023210_18900 [Chryseobacterium ginsengisoli]|uniref:AAA domain-containing protein n=1 Tax=Chryseobacterium ginsengisoli TaxID=363853 RepID=A0ABP9M5G8_9FLAO